MACYNFFDRFKQLLSNKRCRRAIIIFLLFLLFFCIGKIDCFAYSYVTPSYSLNATINSSGVVSSTSTTQNVFCYDLEYGHRYVLINNGSQGHKYGFTSDDEVVIGTVLDNLSTLDGSSRVTIDTTFPVKLLAYQSGTNYLTVLDYGMISSDMGTSLNRLIVNTDFWSPFKDSIPFVGVVVFIAFGFMFITFLIRRVKRG